MINRVIDFSVNNKTVVFLLVALAGLAGWWSLQNAALDAIPDLSETQVIIYSRWDRSPDIIEDQVTYPIVSALLGAPKVRAVRGFSDFGYSFVYVIYDDGTDIYWARSRALEYLSSVQSRLPQGVQTEIGPDATGLGWIYQYVLVDTSGKRSLADLRSYQDWYLKYYLKAVPGVAEVASLGGFGRQYQVNVDPNRLQFYGIPIQTVVTAVRGGNAESGGRLIDFGGTEYMVRGRGYAKSIEDIESIVLRASESGTPIRIKDIGQVTLGPDIRRGVSDLDGTGEAVSGIIVMRQGQNALKVIDRVKARIREIEPGLPEGMKIVPIYDRSDLIKKAISNLKETVLEVLATVVFMILLFPLAYPQRPHSHHHDLVCCIDFIHPFHRHGDHGQYHVARRNRDCDRRPGRCRARGGRTDSQETRGMGQGRPERGLSESDHRGREGSRRDQLLCAAGHRRFVYPHPRPRSAGRPSFQAARLHEEPVDDCGGHSGYHAGPRTEACPHPHPHLQFPADVDLPGREYGSDRQGP
jgi:hypothetical protein